MSHTSAKAIDDDDDNQEYGYPCGIVDSVVPACSVNMRYLRRSMGA